MAKKSIGGPKSHPAVPKSHTDASKLGGHQGAVPGSVKGGQKVPEAC